MHLSRCIVIAFAVAVAACAQTPAKIAALPANALPQVSDNDLCEAVNRSTRTPGVVAEVEHRGLGCDSVASFCHELGHSKGSAAYATCVAGVEQSWVAQREQKAQRLILEESNVHPRHKIVANSSRMPVSTCKSSSGSVTHSCN